MVKQAEQLCEAGQYEQAIDAEARALAQTKALRGPEHAEVAEALARMAELRELMGDFPAAVNDRHAVLVWREKRYGATHWRTADARLMEAFAQKAADMGEPERERVTAALRQEQEAERMEAQGQNAEAERKALEVIEVYRAKVGAESAAVARVWFLVGRARLGGDDAKGAKEANEKSLAIRKKVLPTGHPYLGGSLNNLGLALKALGDLKGAQGALTEAVGIWKDSLGRDAPLTMMGLTNLGLVQRDLQEYVAARRSFEETLAIQRQVLPKDDHNIAVSLTNLGLVQHDLREYTRARRSFEEALAIRRQAQPTIDIWIADSLVNVGVVQRELRDYAEAQKSFEEALAIRRRFLPGDDSEIAVCLDALGRVQLELRDHGEARKSFAEALAIRRQALPKNHTDIADSLNNLGMVQLDLREYAEARKSFEEALAIRRRSLPNDHSGMTASLNNLGLVQRHLSEYAEARKSFEEDLAILRRIPPRDDPRIADCLNNLGLVQRDLREFAEARKSLEEALAVKRAALPKDHPDIAVSLNNLGLVQLDLRKYSEARKSSEEALAIQRHALPRDHPDIAKSLLNLSLQEMFTGIDSRVAVPRLIEATDIFQAAQFRQAIAQAEQEQFATATWSHMVVNLLLAVAIETRADPGPVYDRVVRMKGSVTAQQRWARQLRDTADPDTARLVDRLRLVSQQLIGLSMANRPTGEVGGTEDSATLIQSLSRERAQLERQLSERSPLYRAFQEQARIGASDVRASLPPGTALVDLVEYTHVSPRSRPQDEISEEQRVVAFVLRPERPGVTVVPLGPAQTLAKLIDSWRVSSGAGRRPPGGTADPGMELRRVLWKPLARHLEGVQVVLVSPDGPLCGLPLAALPGAKPGTFLVHEYAFAVVPVPQLLPAMRREESPLAPNAPSFLLAGDIDFGSGRAGDAPARGGPLPPVPVFKPLPGTESEVNDLRARFEDAFPDAPAPKILRQKRATKQAFLAAAPAYRFVHLATHGFFADESEQSAIQVGQRADLLRGGLLLRAEATGRNPGLLSGLVFAGVNQPDQRLEDSILTALEVSEMDLGKVALVVLSACETGRGRVADGEGVLGLQRAFQVAGAQSVVATLWAVPDEESHLMMREFYRRVWSDPPLSKAEALRQAQLWMLENWQPRGFGREDEPAPQGPPPPYVWAAFVLSGDWR